jgi:hypothetical protein
MKLLRAPKVARLAGNGKYQDTPELRKAPNDAKAIATEVTVHMAPGMMRRH